MRPREKDIGDYTFYLITSNDLLYATVTKFKVSVTLAYQKLKKSPLIKPIQSTYRQDVLFLVRRVIWPDLRIAGYD